ncbi:pseudaminic acid cytidylyltransferase [Sphingomonas sp. MAH-20]|jgi:pseudaminic acid cytidylyltransferase|uniref:Pseudaminic acid cytidylyltransferase n=1 Tax=Sphingomonas horti TaxID=2682842 RepID=A0A6I4J1L7_9SPHN|nr:MULTISPECIES: pseudaminic acid cytidylyltransferase [Sphingomonas]MBA2919752.1 pseudaminic acid cytidylyltransferase [Sphingomonas sp. CGMCC 1.13658]MVO77993.1 pseudaminic acid cytidylyltransferase [Sphingomonas horti]
MRVAVIPARGGSKRIPRKNIRPFGGKPMIAYAIDAAKASGAFDRVVVSTDDDEIAAIAERLGAQLPFRRPPELADDHTPTVPVIQHAIAECARLGWAVQWTCCIYPGVPLIDPADITNAWDLLQDRGGTGYSFPVAQFSSPIQRALRREESGKVEPIDPRHVATRTQDLEPAYFDAGQFYWASAETWQRGLAIHAHAHTIILPEWRVVDIDTPDDWTRAEALFRALA